MEEFSSDRVDDFQLQCDNFGDIFFALTGGDGMTNYFHILRSGHFSYFFRKYGNLYLLSQQGWENVNGTYKRTFHNNTQREEELVEVANLHRLCIHWLELCCGGTVISINILQCLVTLMLSTQNMAR